MVSGVLLLEDVSLGWELASLLRAYLHEEGVQTLFTVGVRSASSPFDQALSTMAALRASSLFTSSGACSSLTACGIDSATATYRLAMHLKRSCRCCGEKKTSLSDLASQFSLGESRSILRCSYATEMKEEKPVDEREGRTRNVEPSFDWRDFESAKTAVIPTNEKEAELKSRSIVVLVQTIDNRVLSHEIPMSALMR